MRGTPLAAYQELCRGKNLWKLQLRDFIRMTSRRMLGNMLYDRLRHLALESSLPPRKPKLERASESRACSLPCRVHGHGRVVDLRS